MKMVLENVIQKEYERLLSEESRLKKLVKPDDGYYLEIKKNKGKYVQFYKCKRHSRNIINRTFIKKSDIEVAKKLAQEEFDRKMYADVKRRLWRVESVLDYYKKHNPVELFNKMSPERKALIECEYIDDDTYINQWIEQYKNEDSILNNVYPIETPYYTERGEHVRSKSEMIIADKLSKAGIPYVYEPKCDLNKKGIHPDFLLLNVDKRESFYYEHFGMMDKPEYAIAAVRKIAKYRELGYEYGSNLLYTFETGSDGLNINDLNRIINLYWQK